MRWTRTHGGTWIAAAAVAFPLTVAGARADGGDPGSAAQALVEELGRDAGHRTVVADSMARAADALERGRRMRVAGDPVHAAEAEALALQWAETGRALVRATEAEARANDLHRKAVEAEAQVAKTRELVEEVIARTGRLRAQIDASDHERGTARAAVELHDGERGAPKSRRPEPKRPAPMADGGAP
jgi:hypothetical protein